MKQDNAELIKELRDRVEKLEDDNHHLYYSNLSLRIDMDDLRTRARLSPTPTSPTWESPPSTPRRRANPIVTEAGTRTQPIAVPEEEAPFFSFTAASSYEAGTRTQPIAVPEEDAQFFSFTAASS